MKLIYIYSKHDNRQLSTIERVKKEIPSHLEILECEEAIARGYHVFQTPCMIPILDNLSGDNLLSEGTDGKLLLTATAYNFMDMEEKAIHNVNHARLDSFVNNEKRVAVDSVVDDLIERGIL